MEIIFYGIIAIICLTLCVDTFFTKTKEGDNWDRLDALEKSTLKELDNQRELNKILHGALRDLLAHFWDGPGAIDKYLEAAVLALAKNKKEDVSDDGVK